MLKSLVKKIFKIGVTTDFLLYSGQTVKNRWLLLSYAGALEWRYGPHRVADLGLRCRTINQDRKICNSLGNTIRDATLPLMVCIVRQRLALTRKVVAPNVLSMK